jgi:translation initiation factor 1
MSKMTSGPGWSLSLDSDKHKARTFSAHSPKPRVQLEKRVGKYVTVIAGLHTYGSDRLNTIAKELKSLCGAGGTVKGGVIEIQGDQVTAVQTWLQKNIK